MKPCYLCGNIYPNTVEYFNKHNQHKDGLENRCRNCIHIIANDYYRTHPEVALSYRSRHLEQVREWERNYWRTHSGKKRAKDKRTWIKNRQKYLERHRKYYQANRVRLLGAIKRYRDNHPEMVRDHAIRKNMRRRGAPMDEQAREYSKILRNDPCVFCGRPFAEIDHIQPISKGGTSSWENLTSTCVECNRNKSSKSLLNFLYESNI